LIFRGTHPNEIRPYQPIHPYLASLLSDANVDASLWDQARTLGVPSANLDIERYLFGPHPHDLSSRVHFMGTPDDADFLAGMTICDTVVFPYLEVGQSSSGPISQALELGCRIIASRTLTFLDFAAYHPNAIEFFDIGNHLELAERIAARPQYGERREIPPYNVETNKAVYLAAHSPATSAEPRFRRHRLASRQAHRVPR
jgi:glycosyltransferase involved in cell wall biosynthesis